MWQPLAMNGLITRKEVFTKQLMVAKAGKRFCTSMRKLVLLIWLWIQKIQMF